VLSGRSARRICRRSSTRSYIPKMRQSKPRFRTERTFPLNEDESPPWRTPYIGFRARVNVNTSIPFVQLVSGHVGAPGTRPLTQASGVRNTWLCVLQVVIGQSTIAEWENTRWYAGQLKVERRWHLHKSGFHLSRPAYSYPKRIKNDQMPTFHLGMRRTWCCGLLYLIDYCDLYHKP
jgi:hypothetical protein